MIQSHRSNNFTSLLITITILFLFFCFLIFNVESIDIFGEDDQFTTTSTTQDGEVIHMIQSSKITQERLTPKSNIQFSCSSTQNQQQRDKKLKVKVNTNAQFQTIFGFGGAFTESSAQNIFQMRSDLQQEILNAYYGPEGLQYSIGRVPINSCDFSQGNYSYDTVNGDFSLSHFNITGPDTEFIIPLVLLAKNLSSSHNIDLKLFATPWSPPWWMKINLQMDHSTRPLGFIQQDDYFSSWALYFSKFLTAYAEFGIEFWAVSSQNEPSQNPRWEACLYTPEAQRDFIKYYLGPQLLQDHPNVSIFMLDDQKNELPHWTSIVLSDPVASQFISGSGVHWYTGDFFDALEKTHNAFPDKFILATEACTGYNPIDPGPRLLDWARGEHYGHDIIGDMNHFAIGWTDWNIVLDLQGGPNHVNNYCDAPILVDIPNQVIHYQIPYYYMGQFSKFVPRNSIRIGVEINELDPSEDPLEGTAFITPNNTVVVVVMNRSGANKTYSLIDSNCSVEVPIFEHTIQTLIYEQFD